jgi:hypothetical protein
VVLAAGLAIRVLTMLVYDGAVFSYYGGDSTRYLRLYTDAGLFGDAFMPAGYPAFLRGLRALWPTLPLTIGLQHLIGLATAAVLFAAMRRFGASRGVALVPAAVVALSGDNVFLEHALLTETLWGFSIAVGLYALARAYDQGSEGWLAGAGALLACSALVRNTSLALLPVAAAWAAVALGGPARQRLRTLGAVLVPAVAVLGAYVALAHAVGQHDGLVERGGYLLYMRVAPFADCRRFSPPAATSRLCEATPPGQRLGPLHYGGFDNPAPVNTQYRVRPSAAELGDFARSAILHQPLDYARAVLRDELRYFAPHASVERPDSGARPEDMSFSHTDPVAQPGPREVVAANYRLVYSGVGRPKAPGAGFAVLSGYQEVLRVGGLALAAVAALIVAGLALGRGRPRAVAALLAAFALAMYGLPPLTLTYDVRYGVTPAPLAAAAAALAAAMLIERRRARSAGGQAAAGR